jgi:hypothetical protein
MGALHAFLRAEVTGVANSVWGIPSQQLNNVRESHVMVD